MKKSKVLNICIVETKIFRKNNGQLLFDEIDEIDKVLNRMRILSVSIRFLSDWYGLFLFNLNYSIIMVAVHISQYSLRYIYLDILVCFRNWSYKAVIFTYEKL